MGRADQSSSEGKSRKKSKSKSRMNYLKRQRVRGHGGGQKAEPKTDEFGQLYGDYEPTYYGRSGRPQQQQQDRRGGRGNGWGNRGGWGGRGGGSWGRGRKTPQEHLKPGMKGFLCTTNAKYDGDCVREVYNILNEYYYEEDEARKLGLKQAKTEVAESNEKRPEEMDCQEAVESNDGVQAEDVGEPESSDQMMEVEESEEEHCVAEEEEGDSPSSEEDVDKALAKELKDLKSEKFRVESVKTSINNTVFIRTNVDTPEPVEVVRSVFEDVISNQRPKSRNILRFLPIELTCYANNLDDIKSKGKELIDKYLKVGYCSYRIICNSRLNSSFMRDDFITTFASMVAKANPLSFVDLQNAQYTICVEVLKSIMCIGIVKDFQKFKKYNLAEAGMPTSQEKSESERKNDANSKDNKNKKKINAKGEVSNSCDQVGTDLQKEETAIEVASDEIAPHALAEENQDTLNAAAKSDEEQEAGNPVVEPGEGGQEETHNPVVENVEGGQEARIPVVELGEGGQEEASSPVVVPGEGGQEEAPNPVVVPGEGGQEVFNVADAEPADKGEVRDDDVPDSSVETDNTMQTSLNENEAVSASESENQIEETVCEIICVGSSDVAEKNDEVQAEQKEDGQEIENEGHDASEVAAENLMEQAEYYNNQYWK